MSQAPWSRAAGPAKTTSVRLHKCGEIRALRRESCRDPETRARAPRPAAAVPARHEPAGHGRSHREQSTQTGAHGPGVRPGSPCQQATETRASRARTCRQAPREAGLRGPPVRPARPCRGAERPECRSRSCTSSHDVRLLTRRLHVPRIAGSHRLATLNTHRPECVRNAPSEVLAGCHRRANAPAVARSRTPGRT